MMMTDHAECATGRALFRSVAVSLALILGAMFSNAPSRAQGASGFRVAGSIRVGGEGGWDYITYHAASRRLYAAHGKDVAVIDADSGRVVGTIPNTPGVHGVAISADGKKGFISCGQSATVLVFDPATLAPRGKVAVGENPDAILFDAYSGRVFVFNGRSRDASVIDAASEKVVGTLPLGGKPEFAVTDGAGRIYVNIEDKSEIAVIDARTLKLLARWPLAPGEEPTGLAIDLKRHHLFSVCGNRRMIVLDAASGKILASVETGRGTDGCAFDPGLGWAFASNGEGTVSVVSESSPGKFTRLENVPTRAGARTIAVDPARHILWLPTADFGTTPAPDAERPRPRPPILPGTFCILRLERR